MLKEISALKQDITTYSNIDVLSGKAQMEEFYQEHLFFTNEELRNIQFDRFFVKSII